jgi:tRNA (adenine57-N1/adenine58-N1)-methyltransferase
MPWSSMTLTKPSPEMRGHTSYLTFATFYPASIRAKLAAQDLASEPVTRGATPSEAPVAAEKE